jgi:ABC-type cobalt transport system substrate-binding protein
MMGTPAVTQSAATQVLRQCRSFMLGLVLLLGTLAASLSVPAYSAGTWAGVDESVVEKVAMEHGREAREPFINPDQGDLLLFVFLLAGILGGFTAGYYWHVLAAKPSSSDTARTAQ